MLFFFLLNLMMLLQRAVAACCRCTAAEGRGKWRRHDAISSSSQVCVLPAWMPDKRVSWPCFVHWSNYYLLLLPPRRAGVNCAGNLGPGLCLFSGLQ